MDIINNPAFNGSQINLAQGSGGSHHSRAFTVILQLSIFFFTVSLAWFSFVYYPKAVDKFATVGLPQQRVVSKAANFGEFPIETDQYRIVYEESSNTYYAFIEGKNIAEFADNKNGASLALKSALSLDSVCTLNVIFAPAAKIDVPQDLKNPVNCR